MACFLTWKSVPADPAPSPTLHVSPLGGFLHITSDRNTREAGKLVQEPREHRQGRAGVTVPGKPHLRIIQGTKAWHSLIQE